MINLLGLKPPPHYEVKLIASNDHTELEFLISEWLRLKRPRIIHDVNFVADGAEYTYCAMLIYEARNVSLPRDMERD